ENLLRAQRERGGLFGGQRPCFVERISVQRLRSAEDGGERLERRARDVVVRLLRGQRASRRLRVEAHRLRARQLRAEALLGDVIPDAARGAVLRKLFEEVVVRVEKEGELRRKLVDGETA